jgi:hypothetical protein
MPNYNESTIAGTKWTRSPGGVFNNPYQGMPNISFIEETLIALDDGTTIKQPNTAATMFGVSADMSNPTQEFNVLNPSTGVVTGTATYQQVFTLLHSLYMDLVAKRDYVPPVVPVEPTPPLPPAVP